MIDDSTTGMNINKFWQKKLQVVCCHEIDRKMSQHFCLFVVLNAGDFMEQKFLGNVKTLRLSVGLIVRKGVKPPF